MDRKKLILKIGVPALIVLIIAGIFAFKSWNKDDATVPNSTDTIPLAVQSVDLVNPMVSGLNLFGLSCRLLKMI